MYNRFYENQNGFDTYAYADASAFAASENGNSAILRMEDTALSVSIFVVLSHLVRILEVYGDILAIRSLDLIKNLTNKSTVILETPTI